MRPPDPRPLPDDYWDAWDMMDALQHGDSMMIDYAMLHADGGRTVFNGKQVTW